VIFGREFRSGFFDGSRIDRTERRAIGAVQRFKHLVDLAGGNRKGLDIFLLNQRSEGRSADHSNRHGFRLIQRLLCDLFLALLSRLSGFLGRRRCGRILIAVVCGFSEVNTGGTNFFGTSGVRQGLFRISVICGGCFDSFGSEGSSINP